jgi:predicted transcriptional regulator
VYRPSRESEFVRPVPGASYRLYVDSRANVPYYIYRVSGVELVRRWRKSLRGICASPSNYQGILQGFFAGEGNIKESKSHHSRVLRIAQGKRLPLLERILRHFGVEFGYEPTERSYVISGRDNLERLQNLGVSQLHSIKHAKFMAMLSSYSQRHFKRHTMVPMILATLSSPRTTHEIATRLGRSDSRVIHELTKLRRENEVEMFKVRSRYYWTKRGQQRIVISREKHKILKVLATPKRRPEIARAVKLSHGSVSKRLTELIRLGLVEKVNSNWRRIEVAKRVIVK